MKYAIEQSPDLSECYLVPDDGRGYAVEIDPALVKRYNLMKAEFNAVQDKLFALLPGFYAHCNDVSAERKSLPATK